MHHSGQEVHLGKEHSQPRSFVSFSIYEVSVSSARDIIDEFGHGGRVLAALPAGWLAVSKSVAFLGLNFLI